MAGDDDNPTEESSFHQADGEPLTDEEHQQRAQLLEKSMSKRLTNEEVLLLAQLTQRELNYQTSMYHKVVDEIAMRDNTIDELNRENDRLKQQLEVTDEEEDKDQGTREHSSPSGTKSNVRFSDKGPFMGGKTKQRPQLSDPDHLAELVRNLVHEETDKTDSKAFNFKRERPPTTGRKTRLSDADERRFKSILGKIMFKDREDHTHSIQRVLRLHCQFSEESGLNNLMSIMTLERVTEGAAYDICVNMREAGSTIAELYDVLQSTFRERVSPMVAERKIRELIDKPPTKDITPNLHSIYRLVSLKHEESPQETRSLEITYEAVNKAYDYIIKHYGLKSAEIVRIKFDNFKNRNAVQGRGVNSMHPYALYLKLVGFAETQLRAEGMDKDRNNDERQSFGQHRRIREAVSAAAETDLTKQKDDDEEHCQNLDQLRQQQFLKGRNFAIQQDQGNNKPEQQAQNLPAKCHLCNNGKEIHNPPFWKRCTIFPGQEPLLNIQVCCQGHHRQLHVNQKCPSVLARRAAMEKMGAIGTGEISSAQSEKHEQTVSACLEPFAQFEKEAAAAISRYYQKN